MKPLTKQERIEIAFEEYQKIKELGWKEYDKIIDKALKECLKIQEPAWKEYVKKRKEINAEPETKCEVCGK